MVPKEKSRWGKKTLKKRKKNGKPAELVLMIVFCTDGQTVYLKSKSI